jgi:tetratricopeptide (TPR) repeat protein
LKNAGQMGQEVFIQTLKTVDYRVYRKDNTVIVDVNSLLNGVSANQSNQSPSTENLERKEIAYFVFLTETMRYFNKGMVDLASENFDLILETFPDDVNALFYSGLCALEKKDFQNSISFFESVRIHSFTNFREEAEWKLLNAFILNKDLVKAKSLRDEIVQKNGFYGGQAKSISF